LLQVADMAELGWTRFQGCVPAIGGAAGGKIGDLCIYAGEAEGLDVTMYSLPPVGELGVMVELMAGRLCSGGTSLEVGGRIDTIGCTFGSTQTMVFGNASWLFVVNRFSNATPTPSQLASLMTFRDQQIEAAGGERPITERSDRSDGSHLDRFLPDAVPAGWLPASGITTDFEPLGGVSADESVLKPGDWEFLQRRSGTRARVWTRDDGYTLGVLVSEYPYELLAGLALGVFNDPSYRPIDSSAAGTIEHLIAVDARTAARSNLPFVIEDFRRGRYEFQIVVSGPDMATSEALASEVALLVADLAPAEGSTAPVWPASELAKVAKAMLVTAAVVVAALTLRRMIGGRARRSPQLQRPQPAVADVSAPAAALRRHGRVLGIVQVCACAVIVIALVADIGWWWPVPVAAGLTIGVLATALARRREQRGKRRTWSLTSWRAWLFGSIGGILIVVGVPVAVRALNESVLLPSLAHLRLAERFSTTPQRLAVVMALTGIGLLVVGAILLRRGRAHAMAARARVTSAHGATILYLRSFDDDRLVVPSVHSARRPFFELFGPRGRDPFEECIAWELASHGDVSAVGRPGRSTATLGAARDLLSDDEWQAAVAARMESSRYVVVAIGTTEGLAWELHALTTRGHLNKCIFVVPPATTDEIRSRWRATREVIDNALQRSFVEAVEVVGTLTLRIDDTSGRVSATRADRVDEAAYRAAIVHALDTATASSTSPTSLPAPIPIG
jgi:hypothetical protein